MQRFNPGVLKLKKLINKNFLGNIHGDGISRYKIIDAYVA